MSSAMPLAAFFWVAGQDRAPRLGPPPAGQLYHGVYPGGASGEEDDLTPGDLVAYEKAAGRKAAWVYFSHNWFRNRAFPRRTCEWIRDAGAVPFVRLMLRSDMKSNRADRVFTLEAILAGTFDADLRAWGIAAKEFGAPLVVEWGTECNGRWFWWNGRYNGAKTAVGPERFAASYRHIVSIIRGDAGASNVTWVFHINAEDDPDESWNRFEAYYPGDEWADWIAISAYGPQRPTEKNTPSFRGLMDAGVPRIEKMAPRKPIVVAEFGCSAGSRAVRVEAWASAALDDLLGRRWPSVVGFAWWNERWENDRDRSHDSNMRLQDLPDLAKTFQKKLSDSAIVRDRPAILR